MTDEPKKTFPLEKILTVSVCDYINHGYGARDTKYKMVGVHAESSQEHNLHEDFAARVPINAEVVVSYRTSVATSYIDLKGKRSVKVASGTALVPIVG